MLISLSISAFTLSIISAVLLIFDQRKQEAKQVKEVEKDVVVKLKYPWLTKEFLIFGILMTILSIGIAVTLSLIYTDNTFLFNIKRIALLTLLWPIALIDYKSYRIPNVFIIAGLSYSFVIFIFELIFEYYGIWFRVLSELIAAGALGLAALLCGLIIKNSIGFGDVKLFLVMGLLLSLNGIWSAIFTSLIVSFIISVALLITKKKKRNDTIPFAPAIMIGTYLSVFLIGM